MHRSPPLVSLSILLATLGAALACGGPSEKPKRAEPDGAAEVATAEATPDEAPDDTGAKPEPFSADVPTHCTPGEGVVFGCEIEGKPGKFLSLCATEDLDGERGVLRYRFGSKDAVELEFPSEPVHPTEVFRRQVALDPPRASTDRLSFVNEGHTFTLIESWTLSDGSARLEIETPDGEVITMACKLPFAEETAHLTSVFPDAYEEEDTDFPAAELGALALAGGACAGTDPMPDAEDLVVETYDLGHQEIFIVTCQFHAYQGDHELFWGPLGEGDRVLEDNGSPLKLTGAVDFDPDSGQLDLLEKARGLGDCGTFTRFHLEDEFFVRVEERERACEGDPADAPPPTEWPEK